MFCVYCEEGQERYFDRRLGGFYHKDPRSGEVSKCFERKLKRFYPAGWFQTWL